MEDAPAAPGNSRFTEGWQMRLNGIKSVTGGRLLLPDMEGASPILLVQVTDGSWEQRSFAENGSYITFTLDGSETGIALYAQHGTPWQIYAAVGGAAVLALAIFLIKKKKK